MSRSLELPRAECKAAPAGTVASFGAGHYFGEQALVHRGVVRGATIIGVAQTSVVMQIAESSLNRCLGVMDRLVAFASVARSPGAAKEKRSKADDLFHRMRQVRYVSNYCIR